MVEKLLQGVWMLEWYRGIEFDIVLSLIQLKGISPVEL